MKKSGAVVVAPVRMWSPGLEEGRAVKGGFSDNPFSSLEGVKSGQSEGG